MKSYGMIFEMKSNILASLSAVQPGNKVAQNKNSYLQTIFAIFLFISTVSSMNTLRTNHTDKFLKFSKFCKFSLKLE